MEVSKKFISIKKLKTLASIKIPLTNICLKTKDVTNFDDKIKANIFKKIFCTLADNLLANLHPPFFRFGLHLVRQYYEKILMYPNSKFKSNFVSEEAVLKLLQDWDQIKAAGLDNLSGKFLKDEATILAKPISQICNLSIKYPIFPFECKIGELKPLFKKSSKTTPKNCCPISLLPLVSKITGKVLHDQTQSFLGKNDNIYIYQSGFRKFFSTDSCLPYLNNETATGFESALDTVNHDILFKKMEFIGFSEETAIWLKCYLSNRNIKLHIKNIFSEPGNLLCEVPQGTILGPLCSLLYMNVMPQAVDCVLFTYADDTRLIFNEDQTALNKNFSMLCDWFEDNKLSIHFIHFSESKKNQFYLAANIKSRSQNH